MDFTLAPDTIRDQLLRFDDTDYNSEYDDRGLTIPDLLDSLRNELSDTNTSKTDLTKKFEPFHDSIITNPYIVGTVLMDEPRKFNIPKFQRDYSWTDDQHEEFWFELHDGLGKISEHTLPEMYMGSLYISYERRRNIKEIIDGQQRLMTLLIIIRVISRYIDIINTDSQSTEFWDFCNFVNSDDFLDLILYRANDKPIIEAKEDDIDYFNLLFEQSPADLVESAEDIDFDESGTIRLDTILVDKFGIAEHKLSDYLSSAQASDLRYQATSHRLLIDAFRYYREHIGEYIGLTEDLNNDNLNLDIIEKRGDEIRVGVTSEAIPVANAHITLYCDGNLIDEADTNRDGEETVEIDISDYDEAVVRAERFGETQSRAFSAVSELNTTRTVIESVNTEERLVSLKVLNESGAIENESVSIDNYSVDTDAEGIAEFDLDEVENEIGESLDWISISSPNSNLKFSDIQVMSTRSTAAEYTHEERAKILINLLQVLFHSMRVVYVDFDVDNPEYKIDVFQSLNDRGIDLHTSDIIRARIIGSEATNPEIWDEIYRRHGKDNDVIEEFIEDYLIAEQGLDSASESDIKALFSTSRPEVGEVESGLYHDPDSFLSELNTYSKRFYEINQHSFPNDLDEINGFHHDDSEENEIRTDCERILSRMDQGVEIWKPFVLLLHKKYSDNSNRGEEFRSILRCVERIVLRYSFYGTDISSTVTSSLFPETCREFSSGNYNQFDPEEVRNNILLPNVPPELRGQKVIRQLITKDNWQSTNLKTIFRALAEAELKNRSGGQIVDQRAQLDPDAEVTLEHILPRTFLRDDDSSNKKAWLDVFFNSVPTNKEVSKVIDRLGPSDTCLAEKDEEDIRNYFVDDLGNSVLLSRSVNSAVQNKLFSKKIVYYYLIHEFDLESIGDKLTDFVSEKEDIVKLIDTFANNAGMDREDICTLLGLLVGSNRALSASEISNNLSNYNISSSDIDSTDYDDAKDELSTLVSVDGLDETDDSAITPLVDKYNRRWNHILCLSRKYSIVSDVMKCVKFDGSQHQDEFDSVDVGSVLKEDLDRRLELRPAR